MFRHILIATGILALAYYIGNQTGPSILNETTPYDPADLAPPTPIAEESSTPDSESTPPGQVDHVGEGRRARIISVTAIREASQSRRNDGGKLCELLPLLWRSSSYSG